MISSCLSLPCFAQKKKHIHHRPRRTYRRHRESLYDVPLFAPPPLANPVFIPPSPPPPEPDLPLGLVPFSRPEEPLEPLPLAHYRRGSLPPLPIQPPQLIPYAERVPYLEPSFYSELVPYPVPILYPDPIPYPEFVPYFQPPFNPRRMVGSYGSYLRPDELRVAVDIAVDMILRELREPEYYRDRGLRFNRGISLSSESSRLSDLELEEYVRRMNLVVQIANNSVNSRMMHAEIHPKISDSGSDAGRYPRDFERPRRLEDFFIMDSSTLDRIIQAYGLPRDNLGLGFSSLRSSLNSLDLRRVSLSLNDADRAREQKLRHLFEFLGVDVRDGLRLGDGLGDGLSRRYGGGLIGGGARYGLGGLSERSGTLEERIARRIRD
ncbi:hypothetical protein N431DRAFT_393580 [Stipitochalara longipes BDJ]|nr:hypothetical protein N431DRAFT_393580 [Stipitochalara longipes BDJ]